MENIKKLEFIKSEYQLFRNTWCDLKSKFSSISAAIEGLSDMKWSSPEFFDKINNHHNELDGFHENINNNFKNFHERRK